MTSGACALAAVFLYRALQPFVASLERLDSWNARSASIDSARLQDWIHGAAFINSGIV